MTQQHQRRSFLVACRSSFLLPLLLLLSLSPLSLAANGDEQRLVYRYNICNGLSNQLLFHAASIAQAVHAGYKLVEIPDYFILNGAQTSAANIMPTANNSIPFGQAFDQDHFLRQLKLMGITARMNRFEQQPTLVAEVASTDKRTLRTTNDDDGMLEHSETEHEEDEEEGSPPRKYRRAKNAPGSSSADDAKQQVPPHIPQCRGMETLKGADPDLMRRIIDSFRPSPSIQPWIDQIRAGLPNASDGICLHHRDGLDWREHCSRWSSIPDGVYRGNCLGIHERRGESFLQVLESRGLDRDKWVYYCGDHEIPRELIKSRHKVLSRQTALVREDEIGNDGITRLTRSLPPMLRQSRDFWALIDFTICRDLHTFVGNSVSTFSALQIALRDGQSAYWYNSQSIPLGDLWRTYQVPIVYTYTELSARTGKHLLQTSIESVRSHMPQNKIHVLYHGNNDTVFRSWLRSRDVILHAHDPDWRPAIEQMRLNGNPTSSHLFLHSGNYFGTWQRVDIPLFLDTEYVLLLDADTIVRRAFTLADFGLNLTHGIAMSSEINFNETTPSNAGVTLMNIPHLRHTHKDFLRFVMQHVKKGKFDHPSPSDQGAYLVFYSDVVEFLSQYFNFKPYWQVKDRVFLRSYILHFHGPKPHDYINFILAKGCSKAVKFLCYQGIKSGPQLLCRALSEFARASMSVDRTGYCRASFKHEAQVVFCQDLFERMAENQGKCADFYAMIHDTLDEVPNRLKLPRDLILRKLGMAAPRTHLLMYCVTLAGWVILAATVWRTQRKKRHQLKTMIMITMVWIAFTFLLTIWHFPHI